MGPGPTLDRVPHPHHSCLFGDLVKIVSKGFGERGRGDTRSSCLLLVAQRDTGLASQASPVPKPSNHLQPTRVSFGPTKSSRWTRQLVPPWAWFFATIVDKSKRQTKFEHLVAKEMQPFTRCPGQGKPGIVSFSLSLSRDRQFCCMVGFFIFICVDASHSSTCWNHVCLRPKKYFRPSLLYVAVMFSSLGVSRNQVSASQLRHIITLFRSVRVNYDI